MSDGGDIVGLNDESDWRPLLRPVEVHPHREDGDSMVIVFDPTGMADAALTMSLPTLQILSLIDGEHTLDEIQAEFVHQFGQALKRETLQDLLSHLETAHFLDGPSFEAYYGQLASDYLTAPVRRMNELRDLGLEGEEVATALSGIFPWDRNGTSETRITGLIAPHLDYTRGRPCYLKAYSALSSQNLIGRFVILGTNHFGKSCSVVATSKDFETPLGTSRVDVKFIEELEQRCGQSLRRYEFDHKREHSIELQVLLLQHLLGTDGFDIVPFICPSPCGPSGTAPFDGEGVDLKDFALALGGLVAEDQTPTCIIAGADLSHVGGFFGDTMQLSDHFLRQVHDHDQIILTQVEMNNPEEFIAQVSGEDNPTRVCSAGCIYTLMTALPHSRVRLLDYHQAVNQEMQCCVTCAAAVLETP